MDYLNVQQLGRMARESREKAGLNQTEAARMVGSSQPNISAAESGKSTRYANVATRMIEVLGNKKVEGPFYLVRDDTDNMSG